MITYRVQVRVFWLLGCIVVMQPFLFFERFAALAYPSVLGNNK